MGQVFESSADGSLSVTTTNGSGKKLTDAKDAFDNMDNHPGRTSIINAPSNMSVIGPTTHQHNAALNGKNNNETNIFLNEVAGIVMATGVPGR